MKIKVGGIKKKSPRTKEVSIGGEDYYGGDGGYIGGEDFIGGDTYLGGGSSNIEEGRRRIRELV